MRRASRSATSSVRTVYSYRSAVSFLSAFSFGSILSAALRAQHRQLRVGAEHRQLGQRPQHRKLGSVSEIGSAGSILSIGSAGGVLRIGGKRRRASASALAPRSTCERPARDSKEAARMDFGTFLLLQSPSAETSETVFGRGTEITQAADELGFRSMWLAEHHFSTYGYLSRPLTFATAPGEQDEAAQGRHRRDRAAAPPPAGRRRGDRDGRPAERWPPGRRPGARLPELRVRAARREPGREPRALGGGGRRHPAGAEGEAVQLRGQVLPDPRDDRLPGPDPAAPPADLGHRPEPPIGRGDRPARLQHHHRRLRRADRAAARVPPGARTRTSKPTSRSTRSRSGRSASPTSPRTRPTPAPPPSRPAGTCG